MLYLHCLCVISTLFMCYFYIVYVLYLHCLCVISTLFMCYFYIQFSLLVDYKIFTKLIDFFDLFRDSSTETVIHYFGNHGYSFFVNFFCSSIIKPASFWWLQDEHSQDTEFHSHQPLPKGYCSILMGSITFPHILTFHRTLVAWMCSWRHSDVPEWRGACAG